MNANEIKNRLIKDAITDKCADWLNNRFEELKAFNAEDPSMTVKANFIIPTDGDTSFIAIDIATVSMYFENPKADYFASGVVSIFNCEHPSNFCTIPSEKIMEWIAETEMNEESE